MAAAAGSCTVTPAAAAAPHAARDDAAAPTAAAAAAAAAASGGRGAAADLPSPRRLLFAESAVAAWAQQLRDGLLAAEAQHAARLAGRTQAATQLGGGVTEHDRAMLVEWMLQLSFDCAELRCSRATLGFAVLWLDTALALKPWPRQRLQLLGGGCYWVATKFEEYHCVDAGDMVTLALHGSCSVGELHTAEALLLHTFEYRLPSACAAQWTEEALRVAGLWSPPPGAELPPKLQTARYVMDVRVNGGRGGGGERGASAPLPGCMRAR